MRVIYLVVLLAALGCGEKTLAPAPDKSTVLDGPIDGLTSAQLSAHFAGDEEFGRVFNPATGLGPTFVSASCESCHGGDGKGHPAFNLTRFGRMVGGTFDHMPDDGGPQLQHRAIMDYLAEQLPNGVTGVAVFTPPAVTGLGFLEAVDDTTILALADENDADNDGISGRVQLVDSTTLTESAIALSSDAPLRARTTIGGKYIGRFGKKAGAVNLLHQTVQAYVEDMGITSDLRLSELYNPVSVGGEGDNVADPEVPMNTVRNVVFYLRTLRSPPRRNQNDAQVLQGQALFGQVKCSSCHVPTMRTGLSGITGLNNVEFHPYTDLLLHDMGPDLDDGYTEGRATTREWRTTPLWGAGLAHKSQGRASFYLHDGRARTIREAIQFHGGEGAGSRAAFNGLTPQQQELLIKYVESL